MSYFFLLPEGFMTILACEFVAPIVIGDVPRQITLVQKGEAADVTGVFHPIRLGHMGHHMQSQIGLSVERLLAIIALENIRLFLHQSAIGLMNGKFVILSQVQTMLFM